jgi:hypothetical protein
MGDWVVLAVDQEVCWTERENLGQFRGRDLVLRPPDGDAWADVSIERLPNESYFAAGTIVRRFLSAMTWRWKVPIREIGQSGGTHRDRIGGRVEGTRRVFPGLDFSTLHDAITSEQERALSLYRDALGLEPNHMYKFLGLFRILNIILPNSQSQKNWINNHLGNLDVLSQERVKEIQKAHKDVGHYLYDSGRSALAHAFQPPFIDPDLFDDTYRINRDLFVVEKLVKLFMEQELALPVY